MSVEVMNGVWSCGLKQHNSFVTLLVLADYANIAGEKCYPSIRTIADRARICERSVKNALRDLVAGGWISASRRDKIKGNTYTINIAKLGLRPVLEAEFSGAHLAPEMGEAPALQVESEVHVVPSEVHVVPFEVHVVPFEVHVVPNPHTPLKVEPPGTTRNHQEPSLASSPIELVLSPPPALKAPKGNQLFGEFVEILADYWKSHGPEVPFAFGPADGRQLKAFLRDNPKLSRSQFAGIVRNRADSKRNHAEPVRVWLPSALRYADGPLDQYGHILRGGNHGQSTRGQAVIDGNFAGLRATLAVIRCDSSRADTAGDSDGAVAGSGRSPTAVDDRGTVGLAR